MSVMKIFTVRDVKAEAYLNPFVMRSKGEAIRGFSDEVARKDSAIGAHPADYILFLIGEFDDQTGEITRYAAPENCGVGSDFLVTE